MLKEKAVTAHAKELECEILQKEGELHQHYSQIGKSMLEIAEGEQRIINRLVDEIIAARLQLVQITEQQECPECLAFNDASSRFCKRCGTMLTGEKIERDINDELAQGKS